MPFIKSTCNILPLYPFGMATSEILFSAERSCASYNIVEAQSVLRLHYVLLRTNYCFNYTSALDLIQSVVSEKDSAPNSLLADNCFCFEETLAILQSLLFHFGL